MLDPVEKGQLVADFLAREWVQEAFEEIEAQITTEWKSGSTAEVREAAHAQYRGLEALKTQFQSYVDGGITAQSQLDRAERRKSEI